MYDDIKTAIELVQNKTAPLKSTPGKVIADKGQQIEMGGTLFQPLLQAECCDERRP